MTRECLRDLLVGLAGMGRGTCVAKLKTGRTTHTQEHTHMQEDRNETTKHKHQGRTDCHLAQTDDF